MQKKKENLESAQFQHRKSDFSIYVALKRFYVDDLIPILKGFKRGYNFSILLIVAKAVLQLIILINRKVVDKLVQVESYFRTL